MEVNQNSAVRFCLRVIDLLNQFAALSKCSDCADQRRQLDSFFDQREDAHLYCTTRNCATRALADAEWYMEVATQMAQAHLIVDHNKLVRSDEEMESS